MKGLLRWLGVPLGALGGWYAALILGMLLHGFVERFCPADQIVSGACVAPWFSVASRIIIALGAGLAAVLVVTLATLSAPTHRVFVARLAVGIGAVVALWMAWMSGAWVEAVTAIVCGIATLVVLQKTLAPASEAATA